MNYGQVNKYLDSCLIFGIKTNLVRIQKILELLGDPQKKTDFIHIVGTNGKTSTTKMTAAILKSHGIHTGYHISPHIDSYTERMWVNGRNLSEKKFTGVFNEIYPAILEVNRMDLGGPVTQFEIISAMVFKLAENESIEVMVLEAGMGGRWDATNIADSKVVGLTGVSLEHTEILGRTIRDITLEKVEVIKEKALVATTSSNKEVLEILTGKVEKTGSGLFLYGKDFHIQKKVSLGLNGWSLDIKGVNSTYKNLALPLLGQYQPMNLSLAVILAELYLGTGGEKINEERLRKGISGIRVKGRFEIIRERPMVILDAGHNPEGTDNFIKNISYYFGERKKIIIFAVLADKDYESMVGGIISVSDILILTSSQNTRSLSADQLEKVVKGKIKLLKNKIHRPAGVYKIDTIENSIKFALKISAINDIICITGSITNLERAKYKL
ncbi:MAG: Mur ligase family protein [Actinomycetota bacterium]|nr:Mur ligase family protein [Actinomycetota bacterium]